MQFTNDVLFCECNCDCTCPYHVNLLALVIYIGQNKTSKCSAVAVATVSYSRQAVCFRVVFRLCELHKKLQTVTVSYNCLAYHECLFYVVSHDDAKNSYNIDTTGKQPIANTVRNFRPIKTAETYEEQL